MVLHFNRQRSRHQREYRRLVLPVLPVAQPSDEVLTEEATKRWMNVVRTDPIP